MSSSTAARVKRVASVCVSVTVLVAGLFGTAGPATGASPGASPSMLAPVGQVTPVPILSRSVACRIAPTVVQTNGLCPCASTQGWMWSEIRPHANPASSAARACATRSAGVCSSLENA